VILAEQREYFIHGLSLSVFKVFLPGKKAQEQKNCQAGDNQIHGKIRHDSVFRPDQGKEAEHGHELVALALEPDDFIQDEKVDCRDDKVKEQQWRKLVYGRGIELNHGDEIQFFYGQDQQDSDQKSVDPEPLFSGFSGRVMVQVPDQVFTVFRSRQFF
jgi:hypothetical protein